MGSSLLSGIGEFFSGLYDFLSGIFATLWSWLTSIYNAIVSIPGLILDGLEAIFVPDYEEINNEFTDFTSDMEDKFGFETDFFNQVLTGEAPVTDIEGDYNIPGVGNMNLTFFDSSFFVKGVEFFRPFIRGFLVLLLAFFNIKMILGFIRQDAGVATGKVVDMKTKE